RWPCRGTDREDPVAVQGYVLLQQRKGVGSRLERDDLRPYLGRPDRIAANIGANIHKEVSWPQQAAPYQHLGVVWRVGVHHHGSTPPMQRLPDRGPLARPGQGPFAQNPATGLEASSTENGT